MAKKRLIMILVIMLTVCVWIIWVCKLNVNHKKKEVNLFKMGENVEAPYGECIISEAKMYDLPAFIASYPEIPWLGGSYGDWFSAYTNGNKIRILVYKVDVEYKDAESMDMAEQYPHTIVTRDNMYNTSMDIVLITALNKDINISNDGKLAVKIPIVFSEDGMSEEQWNQLAESDCGLDVLVQANPEEKRIMLTDTEFIDATDEEMQAFQTLVEREQMLIKAEEQGRNELDDNNIYEDGTGTVGKMLVTINSIRDIDLENLKEYNEDNFLLIMGREYKESTEVKVVEKAFEVKLTITNLTEGEYRYCLGNATLMACKGEDIICMAELGYIDRIDFSGKNSNSILLEPNETREVTVLFSWAENCYADGNGGFEVGRVPEWDNDDIYIEFSNFSNYHLKMDKANVYIKGKLEK